MCVLQVIAVKAPGFGERKSSYLEDIAIMTGAQVVKEELGLSLDKVRCISAYSKSSLGIVRCHRTNQVCKWELCPKFCCDLLHCHLVAAFAILLVRIPHAKQDLYQHGMYKPPQGPMLATGMQHELPGSCCCFHKFVR